MTADVPLREQVVPIGAVVPPEPSLSSADCARRVADAVDGLAGIDAVRHELSSGDLASLTRDVLAALQLAESAAVGLVAEAIQRGVVDESTAAGSAQWISRLGGGEEVANLLPTERNARSGPLIPAPEGGPIAVCDVGGDPARQVRPAVPGLEPAVVSRISKVAAECSQPRNDMVAAAVASNEVGVAAARTALIEVDKIVPVLPGSTRDKVFSYFLALPPGSGARAIRELSARVIATFADETFLEDLDATLDATESVTWSELPNRMIRLTAELAPLHAAQVRHAIESLAAPAPGHTCCDEAFHRHRGGEKTGEPDGRTPGKRRADALLLLVTRGSGVVDQDGAVATSGQARIVVTIDQGVLAGRTRGFGRTESGEALDAHLVRQLACDASVLPMVLGSRGEPLDVGREQRLVKDGMRAAVIERDRHCTYPGCGRPPSWCQVHHVLPWELGGVTSLQNSALLCPAHHTVVHRHGFTATVDRVGVTWDLTPGRLHPHMPAA